LLCSDGLSGQITKDDIARVLGEEPDLVNACKKLIEIANTNGGPDNITVILSRFEGDGLPDPSEEEDNDDVAHRVFSIPEGGATPPMAMERITEGPTSPMRPSADRSTMPVDAPNVSPESPTDPTGGNPIEPDEADAGGVDVEADTLDLTPEKRSVGRIIAIGLLVLLVVAAGWFGMQMMGAKAPDSAAVQADSGAAADSVKPDSGVTTPPDSTRPTP
jgi:hypothetical protein